MPAMLELGDYIGRLVLEPLEDGRLMRLVEPYAYRRASRDWPVPAGATVDGASIPRALWTLVGGPFEGKYRKASVIHDHYCETRVAAWHDVHRMFYYAMRASGVSERRAKLTYAGVYFAGPRWPDQTAHGAMMPRPDRDDDQAFERVSRSKVGPAVEFDRIAPHGFRAPTLHLRPLQAIISHEVPELEEIDTWMDGILRYQALEITQSGGMADADGEMWDRLHVNLEI